MRVSEIFNKFLKYWFPLLLLPTTNVPKLSQLLCLYSAREFQDTRRFPTNFALWTIFSWFISTDFFAFTAVRKVKKFTTIQSSILNDTKLRASLSIKIKIRRCNVVSSWLRTLIFRINKMWNLSTLRDIIYDKFSTVNGGLVSTLHLCLLLLMTSSSTGPSRMALKSSTTSWCKCPRSTFPFRLRISSPGNECIFSIL